MKGRHNSHNILKLWLFHSGIARGYFSIMETPFAWFNDERRESRIDCVWFKRNKAYEEDAKIFPSLVFEVDNTKKGVVRNQYKLDFMTQNYGSISYQIYFDGLSDDGLFKEVWKYNMILPVYDDSDLTIKIRQVEQLSIPLLTAEEWNEWKDSFFCRRNFRLPKVATEQEIAETNRFRAMLDKQIPFSPTIAAPMMKFSNPPQPQHKKRVIG